MRLKPGRAFVRVDLASLIHITRHAIPPGERRFRVTACNIAATFMGAPDDGTVCSRCLVADGVSDHDNLLIVENAGEDREKEF